MKKILFVAQNFIVGGVQTSLVNLLNVLSESAETEYETDVFVFGDGELMALIPENVSITKGKTFLRLAATPFINVLERKRPLDIFLRGFLMIYVRIKGSDAFYRKMFKKHKPTKKYDAVISYFNDIPNHYFNRGTNLFADEFVEAEEKIAWFHSDPEKMGLDNKTVVELYKGFDRIICVSEAVKEKLDAIAPEYKNKTEVVYNKFCPELIRKRSEEYVPFEKKGFNIVTVCRVDNGTKRVDGMVRLCKRLKDEGITDFCWRIVGAGPDLKYDKALAKELGVTELILFEGEKLNPYPYVKNSDLFALYSAYEGYPMVIGETQALGVNILTTNYAAAKEQIKEGQGIVAESDEEFFNLMKKLIKGE